MKGSMAGLMIAGAAAALFAASAQAATPLGPSVYAGAGDSPFAGEPFDYFHLEDFQDGLLNTPGLLNLGVGLVVGGLPGSLIDSIEFTPNGYTFNWGSGAQGFNFGFDASVLGALPTHAGLVWTDGRGDITFEAFDENNVSLGTIVGNHADGAQTGQTGEDRFYGFINAGGISRMTIRNTSGGIEVDHVQYGRQLQQPSAVPEPSVWAMLIMGFGVLGGAMRRRRTVSFAA